MRRIIAIPPSVLRELDEARQEIERLRLELEAANGRAAQAEARSRHRCFWCGIKPPTEEEVRH